MERRRRLAQLVAICDVYTWKLLRRDAGLSRRQTELALVELLQSIMEGRLMARALGYTSPARGHQYPLTPILDELRRRGHEVALRTLASEVEIMRARGIDAAPIHPAIEAIEHDDYEARTPLGGLKRSVRVLCRRAEYDARDLERAIDEERPDVVLVDINTWGALAVAERWGGPWAACSPRSRCSST